MLFRIHVFQRHVNPNCTKIAFYQCTLSSRLLITVTRVAYQQRSFSRRFVGIFSCNETWSAVITQSVPFIDPYGPTFVSKDYGNRDVDAWIALLNFAQCKRFSNGDAVHEQTGHKSSGTMTSARPFRGYTLPLSFSRADTRPIRAYFNYVNAF